MNHRTDAPKWLVRHPDERPGDGIPFAADTAGHAAELMHYVNLSADFDTDPEEYIVTPRDDPNATPRRFRVTVEWEPVVTAEELENTEAELQRLREDAEDLEDRLRSTQGDDRREMLEDLGNLGDDIYHLEQQLGEAADHA